MDTLLDAHYPPPPAAAHDVRAFWTSCLHYRQTKAGERACAAPGQAELFVFASCSKCKQFVRREPK